MPVVKVSTPNINIPPIVKIGKKVFKTKIKQVWHNMTTSMEFPNKKKKYNETVEQKKSTEYLAVPGMQ